MRIPGEQNIKSDWRWNCSPQDRRNGLLIKTKHIKFMSCPQLTMVSFLLILPFLCPKLSQYCSVFHSDNDHMLATQPSCHSSADENQETFGWVQHFHGKAARAEMKLSSGAFSPQMDLPQCHDGNNLTILPNKLKINSKKARILIRFFLPSAQSTVVYWNFVYKHHKQTQGIVVEGSVYVHDRVGHIAGCRCGPSRMKL